MHRCYDRTKSDALRRDKCAKPLYYQAQFFCYLGAQPINTVSEWVGIGYNSKPPGTPVIFNEPITAGASNPLVPGATAFSTPVTLAHLASGHAEINEIVYVGFDVEANGAILENVPELSPYGFKYLNNQAVPYPVVSVLAGWGPNAIAGAVPPPINPPYTYTPKGCDDNVANGSAILGAELTLYGYPIPGAGFQAHHIKPSCWGGDNTLQNAVWLPTLSISGYPNLHAPFSTWYQPNSNFTP